MIKIENWTIKNIKQKNIVLNNINLDFQKQTITAIIGKSGIGKTTLINSLCIGTDIISGELYFNNQKINIKSNKEIKRYRKKIGLVSQKNNLVEENSVFDNLKAIMCENNNLFYSTFNIINKKQREQIFKLLDEYNLLDKAFYKFNDLSSGEMQRVKIISLLLKRIKIVLADEPTSNLDNKNSINVIKLLKKNTINNSLVTIVNIHDTSLIKKELFDRVIGIKNKGILFDLKPENITNDILKELYE